MHAFQACAPRRRARTPSCVFVFFFFARRRRSKCLPAPSSSWNPRDFTGIAFQLLNYNSGVSRGCGDDAPGGPPTETSESHADAQRRARASPGRLALGERLCGPQPVTSWFKDWNVRSWRGPREFHPGPLMSKVNSHWEFSRTRV